MILTYSPTTSPHTKRWGGIFYPFQEHFEVFLQTFSLLAINDENPQKYCVRVVRWSVGQFFLRPYF